MTDTAQARPLRERLASGDLDQRLSQIYSRSINVAAAKGRLGSLLEDFEQRAPGLSPAVFTAAGRTEMGGNHTDHQHGSVLASAVDMETLAAGALDGTNRLRVLSSKYPELIVDLDDLDAKESEQDSSISLIRGIARAFADRGFTPRGATILTHSGVPAGSGLSSSAAFEVLIGNALNHLWADDSVSQEELARIGQYAENVYFGKPSGLMDQMASAVGGIIEIDFGNPDAPKITPVDASFADAGYAMCIIDSGADHADLTDDYAAIPQEMGAVARFFGKEHLRDVDPAQFWSRLAAVREAASDRAVARAAHFFAEDARVDKQAAALREGRFEDFLALVRESGASSALLLQNLKPESGKDQSVILAIALAQQLLGDAGAVRVHGGGFAGTIQAYVPTGQVAQFKAGMEAVLGEGSVYVVQVRPVGGAFIAQ